MSSSNVLSGYQSAASKGIAPGTIAEIIRRLLEKGCKYVVIL